jgi:hypothetical protein
MEREQLIRHFRLLFDEIVFPGKVVTMSSTPPAAAVSHDDNRPRLGCDVFRRLEIEHECALPDLVVNDVFVNL